MIRTTFIVPLLILLLIVYTSEFVSARDAKITKKDTLMSQQLVEDSKKLDEMILSINKSIQKVISDNDLLSPEQRIKKLPYQVSLKRGKDFIEVERHRFIRSGVDNSKIVGIKKKRLRVVTNGKTISRIESVISENRYDESLTVVIIIDPSPNTVETKDIKFEYSYKKRLIKSLLLDKIQNTTAFPIKNDIKRNFLIPNLNYFHSIILNIAETYKKGIKDSDSLMADFLKKSTIY